MQWVRTKCDIKIKRYPDRYWTFVSPDVGTSICRGQSGRSIGSMDRDHGQQQAWIAVSSMRSEDDGGLRVAWDS